MAGAEGGATGRSGVRYARSGDVSIAYQVVGDGPVDLVLVPGFVSNVELQWELPEHAAFLEGLARFSRLIVFDKRGTGLSDRLEKGRPPTMEERMDDLRAVMDDAGIEQASILGVSEGGPLALLFTASHQDRVSRLAIFGSFARLPFGTEERAASLVELAERLWGTGQAFAYLAPGMSDDRHLALFARYERQSATPGTAAALIALTAAIDVTGILPVIDRPTLVIHRRDDSVFHLERAVELAEGIPGARLSVLDGSDHAYFAGDTAPVIAELSEFLTGARAVPPANRVLATVLFVDIVDSTPLAAGLGDAAWRNLLDAFFQQCLPLVAAYDGRHVSSAGDGFLATFDGPARAVRCACAISLAAARLGLEVRCGLHAAEVEVRGDDVAGIGVHIGARVGAAARPGEVWVTRTVRDLVAGSGLRFRDVGEHRLKGVDDLWSLYAAEV